LETVQDRSKFVLFTNKNLHTGFELLPTSMTLNEPERRNYRRRIGFLCGSWPYCFTYPFH